MARTNTPPRRNPLGPISYIAGGREADALDEARALRVDHLSPNPYQPRKTFDPSALDELAASIREHGVLQPLLVRPAPGVADAYQIVAGERRWRAAQLASLETIPCIVRDVDDDAMETIALVENIQRNDLTPLDEARAYRRLLDRLELSIRALSERLGKSHTFVEDRLKLVSDPRIEAAIEKGVVGATVAVEIADLEDTATRDALLARADQGERIKVKDVQATRPRSQPASVADNLPDSSSLKGGTGTPTGEEGDRHQVADYLPLVSPIASAPTHEHGASSGATEGTIDRGITATSNDRAPSTRRAPGHNWVAATDTQTGLLFEVGEGYADPDQLRAALWADLEALGG